MRARCQTMRARCHRARASNVRRAVLLAKVFRLSGFCCSCVEHPAATKGSRRNRWLRTRAGSSDRHCGHRARREAGMSLRSSRDGYRYLCTSLHCVTTLPSGCIRAAVPALKRGLQADERVVTNSTSNRFAKTGKGDETRSVGLFEKIARCALPTPCVLDPCVEDPHPSTHSSGLHRNNRHAITGAPSKG